MIKNMILERDPGHVISTIPKYTLSEKLCLKHGDKLKSEGSPHNVLYTIQNPESTDCIVLNRNPDMAIYYVSGNFTLSIFNKGIKFNSNTYLDDYARTRNHLMVLISSGIVTIDNNKYAYTLSPYYHLYEKIVTWSFEIRLHIFSQILSMLAILAREGYLINNLTYLMVGCDTSFNAVLIEYFNYPKNMTVYNEITDVQTYNCHKKNPDIFSLAKQSIPGVITMILAYFFTNDPNIGGVYDFINEYPWFKPSNSLVSCSRYYDNIEEALYDTHYDHYVFARHDVPSYYDAFFRRIILNLHNGKPNGFLYLDDSGNMLLSSYTEIENMFNANKLHQPASLGSVIKPPAILQPIDTTAISNIIININNLMIQKGLISELNNILGK